MAFRYSKNRLALFHKLEVDLRHRALLEFVPPISRLLEEFVSV